MLGLAFIWDMDEDVSLGPGGGVEAVLIIMS